MLTAHRNGGRTSLASFARVWDRYTRASGRPRPASERELLTFRAMLEASIHRDDGPGPATGRGPRDTGERERTRELRHRNGWAWLRPFRRLDEYELALRELERPERERIET